MSNEEKNEVGQFLFGDQEVRVVGTAEKPLFVAKDVCEVLGLRNNRKAVDSLDEDEKGVTKSYTPGGEQEMVTVTESGLYHLIFKSRKVAAKKFRRWVTDEVLPEIRKTGGYHTGLGSVMTLPDWLRAEGMDLSKDAVQVTVMLKMAWEVAKDMGFKGSHGADGFIGFSADVLSVASQRCQEDLGIEDARVSRIDAIIKGLDVGRYYSVAEMAALLELEGTTQAVRCKVGKYLNCHDGKRFGGRVFRRVLENRRVCYVWGGNLELF